MTACATLSANADRPVGHAQLDRARLSTPRNGTSASPRARSPTSSSQLRAGIVLVQATALAGNAATVTASGATSAQRALGSPGPGSRTANSPSTTIARSAAAAARRGARRPPARLRSPRGRSAPGKLDRSARADVLSVKLVEGDAVRAGSSAGQTRRHADQRQRRSPEVDGRPQAARPDLDVDPILPEVEVRRRRSPRSLAPDRGRQQGRYHRSGSGRTRRPARCRAGRSGPPSERPTPGQPDQ